VSSEHPRDTFGPSVPFKKAWTLGVQEVFSDCQRGAAIVVLGGDNIRSFL